MLQVYPIQTGHSRFLCKKLKNIDGCFVDKLAADLSRQVGTLPQLSLLGPYIDILFESSKGHIPLLERQVRIGREVCGFPDMAESELIVEDKAEATGFSYDLAELDSLTYEFIEEIFTRLEQQFFSPDWGEKWTWRLRLDYGDDNEYWKPDIRFQILFIA